MTTALPEGGHPIANEGARGLATAAGVSFAGGLIEALVRCDGALASTSQPVAVAFGVAQVRRVLVSRGLEVVHVVFAPSSTRAILLGCVRLVNASDEAIAVEYTETWDVGRAGELRALTSACERRSDGYVFALADAGNVQRSATPEPPPARGLALDVQLALAPRARRILAFAYAAIPDDEDPGPLVRAFRGEVEPELARIGRSGITLQAYRASGRYSRS